jgi:hypothetical protein
MIRYSLQIPLQELRQKKIYFQWQDHERELMNVIKDFPFIISPQSEEMDMGDYDDDDKDDEVVQKLIQKYKLKDIEPTLDEILEKIHEKGTSSLSIQEQAVLNQFK